MLADGDSIELSHLIDMADDVPPALPVSSSAFQVSEVVDLETLEKRYLEWARSRMGGDLAALAGQLGVSQRTLYRRLQEMRIK